MLTRLVYDPTTNNLPEPLAPALLPPGFTGTMRPQTGGIRLERRTRRPVPQKDKSMRVTEVTDVLAGRFDGRHLILESIGAPGAGDETFGSWVDFAQRAGMSDSCYFNIGNQSADIQGLLRRLEAAGRLSRAPAGIPNFPFACRVLK